MTRLLCKPLYQRISQVMGLGTSYRLRTWHPPPCRPPPMCCCLSPATWVVLGSVGNVLTEFRRSLRFQNQVFFLGRLFSQRLECKHQDPSPSPSEKIYITLNRARISSMHAFYISHPSPDEATLFQPCTPLAGFCGLFVVLFVVMLHRYVLCPPLRCFPLWVISSRNHQCKIKA